MTSHLRNRWNELQPGTRLGDATARKISAWNGVEREYEAYSGSDIKVVMYLPLLNRGKASMQKGNNPKYITFAGLQTISISSTRSISPVRVLGKSNPVTYNRGARTFAGTMVFATIETDPFLEIFDIAEAESMADASSSLFTDQLPPFSVVITAANETGGVATQVLHGITLVNYGTTYSINDLYTETVYSYVATDVTNLVVDDRNSFRTTAFNATKTITQALVESLRNAYAGPAAGIAAGVEDLMKGAQGKLALYSNWEKTDASRWYTNMRAFERDVREF